jgi:acyl transferase domain-containing protein
MLEKLLRFALADAGMQGSGADHLEAHGTGTLLGDPIEMEVIVHVLAV